MKIFKNNTLIIVIFAFVIFILAYIFHPARPDVGISLLDTSYNWEHWFDQRAYSIIATKLVDGTLDTPEITSGVGYVTGLGYPALSVFSIIISSKEDILFHHGFFIPNLLLYVGTVYITFSWIKQLTNKSWISIVGVAAFLGASPYLIWFVEPWNGHVIEFAIIGIAFLLIRPIDTVTKKSVMLACLLAGWIFATRFVDILWVLPILIPFFILNPKKIPYIFPAIIIFALVLFSQWVYLGDPLQFPNATNPWEENNISGEERNTLYDKVGLEMFNLDIETLGNRTFCIFFNPLNCQPEKSGDEFVDNWWIKALNGKIPLSVYGFGLVVLSPLGMYLLLRKSQSQERILLIGLLIGLFGSMIFYTSIFIFTSGWTPFFRYHIVWLPILTVFSTYGMSFVYSKLRLYQDNKSIKK